MKAPAKPVKPPKPPKPEKDPFTLRMESGGFISIGNGAYRRRTHRPS
jgi:hypothetical protein